jgi:hypothetical protein
LHNTLMTVLVWPTTMVVTPTLSIVNEMVCVPTSSFPGTALRLRLPGVLLMVAPGGHAGWRRMKKELSGWSVNGSVNQFPATTSPALPTVMTTEASLQLPASQTCHSEHEPQFRCTPQLSATSPQTCNSQTEALERVSVQLDSHWPAALHVPDVHEPQFRMTPQLSFASPQTRDPQTETLERVSEQVLTTQFPWPSQ